MKRKQNDNVLISIILPIYNIKKYLDKCMHSLLSQTYANLEFIMIDDGSTDGCKEMCDFYLTIDERIKVFHKENGGLSDARNYGIMRSQGEYITCVDPDDFVDNDYIEYLFFLIKKYDSKMSICQHRVMYDNGNIKELGSLGDEKIETEKCLERMLYHDVIDTSAWAKLYHRSLFENVKYPKGKIFEDIATTYALMIQCEGIAVGYESKYNYIFHNNSIVNGEFKPSKFDLIEMTDKMANDIIGIFPNLSRAVIRRQVYARFSTLNQMLNYHGYEKQRKDIIRFIKKYKLKVLSDKKAPIRDKAAIVLLLLNYKLYKGVWLKYRTYLMNK